MIDPAVLPPDVLSRILGTAGGTVVGLAMSDEPRTLGGSLKRIAVSIVFGMFLSDALGEWAFGWSVSEKGVLLVPSRIIAASCISAALGWWIMHAAIRITQTWKRAG